MVLLGVVQFQILMVPWKYFLKYICKQEEGVVVGTEMMNSLWPVAKDAHNNNYCVIIQCTN